MMKSKLLIGLLIILLSINIALAEDFGIAVDCYEGCNNKEILNDHNILLKVTITNNLDSYIRFGEGKYEGYGSILSLSIKKDYLQESDKGQMYYNFIGYGDFIKPHDFTIFYLPLEVYNKQNLDFRVGHWEITPSLILNNIIYFKGDLTNLSETSGSISTYNPINGNPLKFDVKKPEIEINKNNLSPTIKLFKDACSWFIKWVYLILTGVIIGLIVAYIVYKRKWK